MYAEMILTLLGGLGIFLFGISYMGEGLQKAAGERMRKILEKLTTNPIMGVLTGAIVTSILQSSSGTTVMAVGFVNAGLMTLRQAVGIIMGANIGTTMTAQLIAFKIPDYVFLSSIGIGTFAMLLLKKKNHKAIGQLLIGFGLLFLGMETMSDAMKPLREMPWFINTMTLFSDIPILGVFTGTAMTAIVQSSSATIGILQALAQQGIVTLKIALPILFGDNIGTCITALLASIGANLNARRAALVHLTFNIIGTIIFLLLLVPVQKIVALIGGDVARQIANAHTLFNISNTIIQLPFIGGLVYVVTKVLPGETTSFDYGPKFLDRRLLSNPSVAMGVIQKEINRMGQLAKDSVQQSMEAFFKQDEKLIKTVLEREEIINDLDKEIADFLVELSTAPLTSEESNRIYAFHHTINDLERVGDHAKNICELAQQRIDHDLPFSEKAHDELHEMGSVVVETIDTCLKTFLNYDPELANQVLENEDKIDLMEKQLRKSHIKRLNRGVCFGSSGVVFLEIISNLERIGDHSYNIVKNAMDNETELQ